MQTLLRILIVAGLLFWGFLLLSEHKPEWASSVFGWRFDDANRVERCAQFGDTVEGDRAMDYRDRIRQFAAGCW